MTLQIACWSFPIALPRWTPLLLVLYSPAVLILLLFLEGAWAFLQRTWCVLSPVSRRILPPSSTPIPLWIPAQMALHGKPASHPSLSAPKWTWFICYLLFHMNFLGRCLLEYVCIHQWEHLLSSFVKSKKAGFVFGWIPSPLCLQCLVDVQKVLNEGMKEFWFVSKTIFRMPSVFQFLTLSHLFIKSV